MAPQDMKLYFHLYFVLSIHAISSLPRGRPVESDSGGVWNGHGGAGGCPQPRSACRYPRGASVPGAPSCLLPAQALQRSRLLARSTHLPAVRQPAVRSSCPAVCPRGALTPAGPSQPGPLRARPAPARWQCATPLASPLLRAICGISKL